MNFLRSSTYEKKILRWRNYGTLLFLSLSEEKGFAGAHGLCGEGGYESKKEFNSKVSLSFFGFLFDEKETIPIWYHKWTTESMLNKVFSKMLSKVVF